MGIPLGYPMLLKHRTLFNVSKMTIANTQFDMKPNNITKKDSYPLPHMGETINRLGGHLFFTKLGPKSGCFQIPIQEDDKEKTAFILQGGHWEFNVLPQGLKNTPPTFQRTINELLVDYYME
ncbi:unnamed protein product [Didymodactylos carnosus]|uniref:Reverse transcriptase domain-containing protein n=1 Tax=Didymodactylos carnosus TaxID=1234261 RepID=A0A814G843_9BILA|nr:unnamed protein product [Didymodactylos carnosus]CAF0992649.1 unnamed protein product [Didymodactylos carnosus]CAF3753023.1 unnamed protein product [Didymodactylos carnosus]CAF3764533.1 unnamed protein product [Didymodactylos carnosus]